MNIFEKLLELRTSSGKSQAEFAKLAGVSQRTWSSYESGEFTPKIGVLWTLAANGYPIEGVTTGSINDWPEEKKQELQRRINNLQNTTLKTETPLYTHDEIKKMENVIPLLDQKLSADSGQELPNADEVSALIPVPPSLAKYGKNLAALTVEGDSMYPTLERGDLVVCDSCGWSGEGIYAMRMGGDGFVKRITKAPGKIVIISDNPKYPIREEPEGSQDFDIIGRVHYAIKNMERE